MRRKARVTKGWVDLPSRHSLFIHYPFCQLCLLEGRETIATDPDHVLGRGWRGADDHRALLAVCRPCHERLEAMPDGVFLRLLAKFRSDSSIDIEFLETHSHTLLRGRLRDWLLTSPHPLAARMLEWIDGTTC